jgi:sensor histidine kinase YesM
MIEVINNFSGTLIMNEESGLPESTKEGQEHGYGLLNIRKVAQKYYGDIDTTQDRDEFRLSVMLMVE